MILTWIVPTVVVVMIWRWLFSTSGGMVNPLLMMSGATSAPIGFFATPWTAFATLVFVNSWRWFPFIALIILAGLTRIPSELHEAARVDDVELLMTVMDAREAIEDAVEEADLGETRVANDERMAASVAVLGEAFAADDVERAKREAVKLRYWCNIADALRDWEKGHPSVLAH